MRITVRIIALFAVALFATGTIAVLFSWSEKIIHYRNNFTRRFPPHAAQEIRSVDLKFNSYYFAGTAAGKIYLGNFTAPLLVTEIDTALKTTKTVRVLLDERKLPFQAPQIRIFGNHFYVYEGTVPYIFKGSTASWSAILQTKAGQRFSQLEPLDENRMAVRYDAPGTAENLLGVVDLRTPGKDFWNEALLQKQFNGIFDTDGALQTDPASGRVVYTYLYRNQFIVAGADLKLHYRGNTIDTVTKAQIKLKKIGRKTTMAAPPLIVNRMATVADGLLFVDSTLPGQNESDDLWKRASIIDVYDLADKSYQGSIPIYMIKGKRARAILVRDDHLFALIGERLVSYFLRSHLTTNRKFTGR